MTDKQKQNGDVMDTYQFEKLKAFSENNEYHVTLNDEQLEQFRLLCSFLLERNLDVNLTAIKTPEEVELKHFIDSLTAVDLIKKHSDGNRFSLIDIGCGAGFPGLPLKIEFPNAEFVLVDSISKKTNFVKEAVDLLKLDKIVVENERAEFLARTAYREKFDFCTARAVADMSVLLEFCMPFVKEGGYCIFFKSAEYQNELDSAKTALEILGGEVREVEEFVLPFSTASRSLIAIKKLFPTPDKYPRRAGKIEKDPLGSQ